MKSTRVVFLVVAVLLLGSIVQAQQTRVQATIPFNFLVGDKVYPAGEYNIQPSFSGEGVLRLDRMGDPQATLVPSNTCTSLNPSETTKLIFHRMGGAYFLYQIWTQGNNSGREFPRSKTEIKMAYKQPKPDLVIVAANTVH